MRTEEEIQDMANRASNLIRNGAPEAPVEVLTAIRETLDWVLDETIEDDPV